VHATVLTSIVMSAVLGGMLIILGHFEAYGQTSTTDNSTFAEAVDCFVNPCDENATAAFSLSNNSSSALVNKQNTTTALVGIAFNNATLKDIQENKEKIKSSVNQYINTTIDNLAGGQIATYTIVLDDCIPSPPPSPPQFPQPCIVGIVDPQDPPIDIPEPSDPVEAR
jgi:hypothetical protein